MRLASSRTVDAEFLRLGELAARLARRRRHSRSSSRRCRPPCRRPPRCSALASSRVSVGSVPVSTKVLPRQRSLPRRAAAALLGPVDAGLAQLRRSPRDCAARRRNRAIDSATTGPTSGTSSSSASLAASSASNAPKCRARSFAVASPTWRMPSAKMKRASVVLPALRRSPRSRWRRSSRPCARAARASAHAEPVEVGRRVHEARVDQLIDELVAQALDVHRAPAREMQQRLLALRGTEEAAGAARDRLVGKAHDRGAALRAMASASRTRGRPRAASRDDDRRTSGITSPARRTITVSPMRTSLRRISSSLCSVALVTVTPPTNTGSSRATGVMAPVRPTCTSMPTSSVCISSGGKLVRDRPARLARDEAELALQREVVDLVDDAVDVERQLVAPRRDRVVERHELRRAVDDAPVAD